MKRVKGSKIHVEALLIAAALCERHAEQAMHCRDRGQAGAGLAHDMCASQYARSAVVRARELQQLGAFA